MSNDGKTDTHQSGAPSNEKASPTEDTHTPTGGGATSAAPGDVSALLEEIAALKRQNSELADVAKKAEERLEEVMGTRSGSGAESRGQVKGQPQNFPAAFQQRSAQRRHFDARASVAGQAGEEKERAPTLKEEGPSGSDSEISFLQDDLEEMGEGYNTNSHPLTPQQTGTRVEFSQRHARDSDATKNERDASLRPSLQQRHSMGGANTLGRGLGAAKERSVHFENDCDVNVNADGSAAMSAPSFLVSPVFGSHPDVRDRVCVSPNQPTRSSHSRREDTRLRIRDFTGSPMESVDDWIFHVNLTAKTGNWSEPYKLGRAANALGARALQAFRSSATSVSTFDELALLLSDQFDPGKRDEGHWYFKLLDLVQNEGEDIVEYKSNHFTHSRRSHN